jgi:soluble lytic murein transglycosylase-like protein
MKANQYHVSSFVMKKVIDCESEWNTHAVSPTHDYGIAQINKSWHFTKEQMFDPEFSIDFMAQEFKKGHQKEWSCYRHLKAKEVV